jgi:hypothetical protein
MRSQANSVRSRGILRAVPSGLEADDPQALRLFSTTCGSHDENKGTSRCPSVHAAFIFQ